MIFFFYTENIYVVDQYLDMCTFKPVFDKIQMRKMMLYLRIKQIALFLSEGFWCRNKINVTMAQIHMFAEYLFMNLKVSFYTTDGR